MNWKQRRFRRYQQYLSAEDDDDNKETIEVISRQAVMDTLIQTYFKYESERLDAIQNLPIYTIPKPEEN